ncbi:MAG TPA: hypothetical protein VF054_15150 [Micromonosporaceae bacterium]
MTTTETNRRIPGPLYAAAGAGDLVYQQLRKLPTKVVELRERADTDLKVDVDKVRDRATDAAQRNLAALLTTAQAVQERAAAVYTELVARGERVVRGAEAEAADTALTVATELEAAANEPAEVEAKTPETTPATPDVTAPVEVEGSLETKPVKRNRPSARK